LSELSSFHKIKIIVYRIKLQVQTTHKIKKLYMININQSVLLLRAVMEQLIVADALEDEEVIFGILAVGSANGLAN
jgi:hypothetical protein